VKGTRQNYTVISEESVLAEGKEVFCQRPIIAGCDCLPKTQGFIEVLKRNIKLDVCPMAKDKQACFHAGYKNTLNGGCTPDGPKVAKLLDG